MAFSGSSRSKKILSLMDQNRNISPDQEFTQHKSNHKNLIQVPTEQEQGIDNSIQLDQEMEIPNQAHDQEQDPSCSSSSSSDSSNTSFCEDSDDSVKDPIYTPPEPPLQNNFVDMPDEEIDELLSFNNDIIQNSPPHSAENVSLLQTAPVENMNTTVSPTSPPAKVGRKRKRNDQKWKRNITKKLRNTGQAYESAGKKMKEKRTIKEPCGDKCRLKCSSNLTEEERKSLFEDYWALSDIKKQWDYISKSMTLITPKYRYVREGGTRKPRQKNNAFYFKLPNKQVRVCKIFFKNTLGINDRPIRTVLEKQDQVANCLLADDKRGKHKNHKQVDETIKDGIRRHIDSIPKVESHYTRANSSRLFIDGSKTIVDIHNDYVETQKQKNLPFGNYVLFYRIFTEEYNISFFTPKKDLCDLCVAFENAENKEERKEEHEKHLKEKQLCRMEKAKDKAEEKIVVAVYDLQAVFQCPKGDVSVFYYKCKLNVLNFTICDLKTNKVECYVWDESNANRGVNDLGTCVYKYLEKLSSTHNGDNIHAIFYSDNCAGQQKNKAMVALYLLAVQKFPHIQSITHKYLIKGHTQNEGDAAHSLIERQVKKVLKAGPMYSPEAFIGAIKSARKKPEPFHVNEMCTEDFYDWKDACAQMGVNITKNEEGNSVKIADIKILKVEKNSPRILYYKTSYGDTEFKKADIIKKKRLIDVDIKKAYDRKPGVSERIKADLLYLLDKNLIPRFYAPFYNSL